MKLENQHMLKLLKLNEEQDIYRVSKYFCYWVHCVPPKPICWSPHPRTLECDCFKGDPKVQWGHMGGALIPQDWYPYKKRKIHQWCVHRGRALEDTGGGGRLQHSERSLQKNQPVHTLILTSRLHNYEKIHFCCLIHPVTAAWANTVSPQTTYK